MALLKSANLALRFFLELGALGALGYWGFRIDRGLILRVTLGLVAPLPAALIWGTFVAPRAPVQVSGLVHLALEFAVLGLAAAALYAAGRPALAMYFGLAVVINRILMAVWGQ